MPPVGFNASWDKMDLRKALEWLPEGRGSYSTRVWEVEAAQREGRTIEEWYTLPLKERTYKITSHLVPLWITALEARYTAQR